MFELGAAVMCATDNQVFGPETVMRFDYAQYYLWYALGVFVFYVFLHPWIGVFIGMSNYVTFGLGGYLQIPYQIAADYVPLFATLWLTNMAYEGFHPTVAPQIAEGEAASM